MRWMTLIVLSVATTGCIAQSPEPDDDGVVLVDEQRPGKADHAGPEQQQDDEAAELIEAPPEQEPAVQPPVAPSLDEAVAGCAPDDEQGFDAATDVSMLRAELVPLGRALPGERLVVAVRLANLSPQQHMNYPGVQVRVKDGPADVGGHAVDRQGVLQLYGIFACDLVEYEMEVSVHADAEPGDVIELEAAPSMLACGQDCHGTPSWVSVEVEAP